MSNLKGIGIILNPAAGKGRAGKMRTNLVESLRTRKITFELEVTKNAGHAKTIAQQMSDEKDVIIAIGGDGTINEVLPGVIGSNSTLAIIPIGSGNDFNKVIGIPQELDQALNAIFKGKRRLSDIGEVIYWNKYGEKRKRYFINTLGMGLDAEIASETKQISFLRGLPLYLWAAIKALSKHSSIEFKIREKNDQKTEKAFFICAGNGCFEGGGFKILPNARQNDSLLDICVLRATPLLKAIKILPSILKGTHEKSPEVSIWKTKEITIESKKSFILHGDGEIFGKEIIKAQIAIAKNKVRLIYPDAK
jgi:diacylglycerol kinase (ATP)